MLNHEQLFKKIKQITKEEGITARELEENIELKKATISNIKRYTPSIETIAKLADYLNCTIDELLERNIEENQITKKEKDLLKAYKNAPGNIQKGIDALIDPYKDKKNIS